jgi:hypothetical protein
MGDQPKKTGKDMGGQQAGTDDRGRNVWIDPIDDVELELVSTAKLKLILDSGNEQQKDRIRELADGEDGVLACSTETNRFEVLKEDELTLEAVCEPGGEEEDSLVTTQALRKILKIADEPEEPEEDTEDESRGYNPYDSGSVEP